jgi:hypothetical protein
MPNPDTSTSCSPLTTTLTFVNRSVCGCSDPWVDPAEGIGYYTALPDRGLFISTVLADYGCSSLVCQLGWRPCPLCGQPDIYGAGPALNVRTYPRRNVTPAGLAEAHDAYVAQVRSGKVRLRRPQQA